MAGVTSRSVTKVTNKFYTLHFTRFMSSGDIKKTHCDIIVAGGGMVGTAIACALASEPKLAAKKILLLEGGPKKDIPQKRKLDPYSNRVVSLNPGSRKFLERLGAWKYIDEARYATVKKLQVWESSSDALITFDHPGFTSDISYIVENDLILYSLRKVLDDLMERVTVRFNSKVTDVSLPKENGQPCVTLDEGKSSYSCDLLIGAEGFNSATRQAMGVQYLNWSYKQSGVVATLRLSEPTENIVAWQRFLPTGPIALLPLTNELSSLVWSTTPETAAKLVKMADGEFVDAVNDAIWKPCTKDSIVESATQGLNRLLNTLSMPTDAGQQLPPSVKSVLPESRAAFPLGFGHAASYINSGAVLIGDAAHRVHPLAGQGVNLGFGDAECLTEVMSEAVYSGEKIGSISHLSEYQRRRQCHNFPTMLAIDALQKLYGTSAPPFVLMRSLGMQFIHSLTPLKRAIMERASV